MQEPTIAFSIHEDKEKEIRSILTTVYDALQQKGYKPINQIVGYILSEDPTYITTHNNARSLIRKIDRDELLQVLVKSTWTNSFPLSAAVCCLLSVCFSDEKGRPLFWLSNEKRLASYNLSNFIKSCL